MPGYGRRRRSLQTSRAFDRLVRDTLNRLPRWVHAGLSEVTILIENEPPRNQPHDLLGLYSGCGIGGDASFASPPVITIYRRPHERLCRTQSELRREVAETVLHEIAHHFGLEEEDITRLDPSRVL